MGHIEDKDFEILVFLLNTAIDEINKRYKYTGNGMSGGMAALLKRAGQLVLIIQGRADEIRSYDGPVEDGPAEEYNI